MTHSASEPHIIAACRELKVPLSPRRLAVVRALANSHDHPTIDELRERASVRGNVSLATVYRTLELLLNHKLAYKYDFGGTSRYEDATRGEHAHLIEMNTGKVIDFRDPRLDAAIAELLAEKGLKPLSVRLDINCESVKTRRRRS